MKELEVSQRQVEDRWLRILDERDGIVITALRGEVKLYGIETAVYIHQEVEPNIFIHIASIIKTDERMGNSLSVTSFPSVF